MFGNFANAMCKMETRMQQTKGMEACQKILDY